MLSKTETSTGESARRGLLRIIATTDLHGVLMPYDYFTDTPKPNIGLIALSGKITQLRDTAATTLLLDNGDFLQGTPLTDTVVTDQSWQGINPMIEAMNALDYDAVTLGNHEFNFGIEALRRAISDFSAPVVSANIFDRPTQTHFVDPFVLLDRKVALDNGGTAQITIGVLGLAPPQITTWDARVVGDEIETIDILDAAAEQIPRMKEAGADLVVVLAHTGIGSDQLVTRPENVGAVLAKLRGIDALVLGHTHDQFPTDEIGNDPLQDGPAGTLHGVPTIMPAALGHGLGHIDLSLTQRDGRWAVEAVQNKLHVADSTLCPVLLDKLPATKAAHARTLDLIRTPMGETQSRLHSFLSSVANCPIVQLINDAQRDMVTREINANHSVDLPILSVASAFKSGGHGGPTNYVDIPLGSLAICNAAEIYPFPNTLCAAVLTGAEITRWLERAASVFMTLDADGGVQPLLNPDFPSYDFDVFDGLSYDIDLTGPAMFRPDGEVIQPNAQRIKNLRHNGTPVGADTQFVVATNNYRIGGGGGFFQPDPTRILSDTKKAARNVLIDYIKSGSPINVTPSQTWSFQPIPGAVGVFETGSVAKACADLATDRTFDGFSPSLSGGTTGRLILD